MSEQRENTGMVPAQDAGGALAMVQTVMEGFVGQITRVLENNSRAMEQCAQAVNGVNERMNELEKQMRVNTPLTHAMANYLTKAIRDRARELAATNAPEYPKAPAAVGREIRKALFTHYGVSDMRSIPRHAYDVAMERVQAQRWTTKMDDAVRGV